jgi:hypothetical protein
LVSDFSEFSAIFYAINKEQGKDIAVGDTV